MLDEFAHLSKEAVYGMASRDWLVSAFHLACSDLKVDARGLAVLSADNGIWRVSCLSMRDAALLLGGSTLVVRKIHALHDIRPLPRLCRIVPVPQSGVGMPLSMLRSFPFHAMPDVMWRDLAWKIAVDPGTASSSEVVGIKDGIWTVRCHSEHAWNFLKSPGDVIAMLVWLSALRKLPEVRHIRTVLGRIAPQGDGCVLRDGNADETPLAVQVDDPEMRRIAARIQYWRNRNKS